MLCSAYVAHSVNSCWWHGEIELDDLTLCSCDDGRVVDKKERDGGSRWKQYGGFEQLWEIRSRTSATTLVSVRNTRVFRTALTALTQHSTVWRRIPCYPSPWPHVAFHRYILYFLVTYTHQQDDTCVTLFAVAVVMRKLFTQCLAMFMHFSGCHFFGNGAGAPGNHSYYLSFNDFQNLYIQYVFSYMYLCIYIAMNLHTVYLDWQHAVIVSN